VSLTYSQARKATLDSILTTRQKHGGTKSVTEYDSVFDFASSNFTTGYASLGGSESIRFKDFSKAGDVPGEILNQLKDRPYEVGLEVEYEGETYFVSGMMLRHAGSGEVTSIKNGEVVDRDAEVLILELVRSSSIIIDR
jgi:hypothetical protein